MPLPDGLGDPGGVSGTHVGLVGDHREVVDRADAELVAVVQLGRGVDPIAVDEGPICRVDVFDEQSAPLPVEPTMPLADPTVIGTEMA